MSQYIMYNVYVFPLYLCYRVLISLICNGNAYIQTSLLRCVWRKTILSSVLALAARVSVWTAPVARCRSPSASSWGTTTLPTLPATTRPWPLGSSNTNLLLVLQQQTIALVQTAPLQAAVLLLVLVVVIARLPMLLSKAATTSPIVLLLLVLVLMVVLVRASALAVREKRPRQVQSQTTPRGRR
jgi:hypothetical protein